MQKGFKFYPGCHRLKLFSQSFANDLVLLGRDDLISVNCEMDDGTNQAFLTMFRIGSQPRTV